MMAAKDKILKYLMTKLLNLCPNNFKTKAIMEKSRSSAYDGSDYQLQK